MIKTELKKVRVNAWGSMVDVDMTVYHWESCTELANDVKEAGFPLNNSGTGWDKASGNFRGRYFANGEECLKAEGETWEEGVKVIEDLISKLEGQMPAPVSRRRKPRWMEDDGSDLCLDRLRSGQPYWRESRRQNTHGPSTITLVVDVTTSGGVKADDALWRGAAAVAMTKVLEDAGYRVELIAVSSQTRCWTRAFGGESKNGAFAVTLKKPEQPVNLSSLTNWISAWAYRSLWFSSWNLKGEMSWGYGTCVLLKDSPAIVDALTTDTNRLVISDCWKEATAIRLAKDLMNQIGTGELAA